MNLINTEAKLVAVEQQVASISAVTKEQAESLCATIRQLWAAEEFTKELAKSKLPCGHLGRYGYTTDGGANIVCLLCEWERDRWIPVSERPKSFSHEYLTITESGDQTVRTWDGTRWLFDCPDEALALKCEGEITHWRPLHAPPALSPKTRPAVAEGK